MMLSSDSAIVEGLRSTTLFSFGLVQNQILKLDSYFSLRKANKILNAENTKLAFDNFQLQEALLENIRLRKLLQFKEDAPYNFTPGKIIGSSPLDFITGYLLSFQKSQPVQKNTAVVTSEGLVGKIIKVSADYAICQNLFDPNSKVSVRVQRNRELGIVAWDGMKGLLLENISNTIEIKPGDVLFTSGMSRTYPPNIKVGIVSAVHKNEEELFQAIQVIPAVNFNNIKEIAIIQSGTKDEI